MTWTARTVVRDAVRLACRDWGGSGPPVVLLHGLAGHAGEWGLLARELSDSGWQMARAAGATHATVACLGAPGHPAARGLYYGLGFRQLSRDVPLIKTKTV